MEIESSAHLFQRPFYRAANTGAWESDITGAIDKLDEVSIDAGAVGSVISFGMIGGTRTLFNEIKRKSWLYGHLPGEAQGLLKIPPHDFVVDDAKNIASNLYRLLEEEAIRACNGFNDVYILLSGGLDSRIVAGVLSNLYRSGSIRAKPVGLTWGTPNSRDVVYAQKVANKLGLDWQHVGLEPEDMLDNIEQTGPRLGLMHSPEMLHSMLKFGFLAKNSVILAGSFGDSIGRAEFAGLHLLQLKDKQPNNALELLNPAVISETFGLVREDLTELRERGGGSTSFAKHEHWMQGYRMRGGLCHALTVINDYSSVYQMFTAPPVYEYMWSLHPAVRNDEIYVRLLQDFFPEVAYLPWPRTDKALRGRTIERVDGLDSQYHDYTRWSSREIYSDVVKLVDPEWFASTGLFSAGALEGMNLEVRRSTQRVGRINDLWLWLAGFRSYINHLENKGMRVRFPSAQQVGNLTRNSIRHTTRTTKLDPLSTAKKSALVNSLLKMLRNGFRKVHLAYLRWVSLKNYPPKKESRDKKR